VGSLARTSVFPLATLHETSEAQISIDIVERDWKVFRTLLPFWQERYCRKAIQEIRTKLGDAGLDEIDRFEAIAKLSEKRHRFYWSHLTDFRRSTMIRQIRQFYTLGLIDPHELAQFSQETQEFASRGAEQ
jgi:hypothetical protein